MNLSPRDTWPDLRFILRPLPWTWRLKPRVYWDDIEGPVGHSSVSWLFLTVEWWANRPLFTEKNTPTASHVCNFDVVLFPGNRFACTICDEVGPEVSA